MKKIILLGFLFILNYGFALEEYTIRNNNLRKKFQDYKDRKIEKSEFIDYVNNELNHPLVDFHQDDRGIYQWLVSNDKFLASRGISSLEEINILKAKDEFKIKKIKSNFSGITAYGNVEIKGDDSTLDMNVMKVGVAYNKSYNSNLLGEFNIQASTFINNYINIDLAGYDGANSLTTLIPEINLAASKQKDNLSYGLKYSLLQYFVLKTGASSQAQLNLESVHRISPIASYRFNSNIGVSTGIGYLVGNDISGTDYSLGLSYTVKQRHHMGISLYGSDLSVISSNEKSSATFASYAYSF